MYTFHEYGFQARHTVLSGKECILQNTISLKSFGSNKMFVKVTLCKGTLWARHILNLCLLSCDKSVTILDVGDAILLM